MKRRGFLSWLGIGGPAVAATALIGKEPDKPKYCGPPLPASELYPEEAPELKICYDLELFRKHLHIDTEEKYLYFTIPPGYDAVATNTLYSVIMDTFDEPGFMCYSIPISAQTPDQYSIINGWNLDESCFDKIADGSIQIFKDGREFMSIWSVGKPIKDVRCTWEILVNGEVDKVGEFRTIGHFNELIEITGYDKDNTTIKVITDDNRRFRNTFETHCIFAGKFIAPLSPNDIYGW